MDVLMFSRRHPYLFFLLMISAIFSLGIISVSLLFVVGVGYSGFGVLSKVNGEKVGVIEIIGPIVESKETLRQIRQFREDDEIKAIVVRIESPGGGVAASQEIFREIRRTVPEKKMVASMGAVAASGGYYVAAGTDGIMANPGTITGSIGVIMGYTNFETLFEKIGLTPVVIKSGEYKDMGSPVRKITENEKDLLQAFVNKTRLQFVRDVSEGRDRPASEIEPLADGRIFTGEEAKENGLVDRMGNLEDAIEWAGRMGGIQGEIVPVYPHRRESTFLNYLTESLVHELSGRLSNPSFQADYIFKPATTE
jgi:protease IV